MDGLSGIGWSLISFGILIGFGTVLLTKFGDVVVTCANIGGGAATWNSTLQLCQNASGSTAAGGGAGYTAISYVITQLGQSGLAGWIPMIILLFIMGLVFVYFGHRSGKNY